MSGAPLKLLEAKVRPEWIDYNGHMNVAYYVLAFDEGTDVLMDRCGLHADYRERTGCTIYVVESHITYLRELKVEEAYRLSVQLIGHDAKRIHCVNFMHCVEGGELAATYEVMMLHIGQRADGPATEPFPASVSAALDELAGTQMGLPIAEQVGRVMRVPGGRVRSEGGG